MKVSFSSRWETSITIESGMSVGSASMLSSRVTWSSTPPWTTPGASSTPVSSTGTSRLDDLLEVHFEQVDVREVAAHGVVLLVLDDHRNGVAAELGVEQSVAGLQGCAKVVLVDAECLRVAAAAVKDAGDVPGLTEAAAFAGTKGGRARKVRLFGGLSTSGARF